MDSTPHTEFSKLADLVEERLANSERQAVLAHLAACQACSAQRVKLEKTLALMRANDLQEAPRYALAQVVDLFQSRPKPKASLSERLVALLKFDSQQMTPAFGVRAAATAPQRQLLFTAGD